MFDTAEFADETSSVDRQRRVKTNAKRRHLTHKRTRSQR